MAAHAGAPAPLPQLVASDPRASVWVSANAGSGKTFVLVRRVLRLLLETDVRPEQILCLTYTKAAAAEMKNRVLDELRKWAVAPDEDLRQALQEACGREADAELLSRARRLFAGTLDARGGLKIYTIHAFCERLLHRFPLEADVPPAFRVLDAAQQVLLMNDAIDATLLRAASDGDGPQGRALATVIGEVGEDRFRELIQVVLARRADIQKIIADFPDEDRIGEAEETALRAILGVAPGRTLDDIETAIADALPDTEIAAMLPLLADGQKTDQECGARLDKVKRTHNRADRAALVEDAFLTQAGTARKRICTKAVSDSYPQIAESLSAAAHAVEALVNERTAMRLAAATGALLALADAIFTAYARRKAAHAALDFEDLIEKAGNLLTYSGAAAWVLFKLDYGIDHILVDESQDTSPAQWRIVKALTDEFFSGEGARPEPRTLFAVGDEKQSIYSFQGARPEEVHRKGHEFRAQVEGAGLPWEPVQLTVSYRSVEAVLESVDRVFERPEASAGLIFGGEVISHLAYRARQPGLVEIWPVELPGEAEDIPAFEPDRAYHGATGSTAEALAGRIADTIRGWIDGGERLADGKAVRPGHVLILLRKRLPLARPVIRALKDRGIPVAGADRMKLAEHIAVKDMAALGDFVLLEEDDLSLAALLKSPLFSFDDDDLFELCRARTGSLWKALQASDASRHANAADRLAGWRRRAALQPPYEFFARILEEPAGSAAFVTNRQLMLARLGADAGDALDELLNLALVHERDAPPSLQVFLDDLRAGDLEVKRDMEQGRDEVRVMTVHAAKGLEAPIVFLPDTCRGPTGGGSRPEILDISDPGGHPHLLWKLTGSDNLEAIIAAKDARKAQDIQEYHRLLYVAMTRARDRLYICGAVNTIRKDGSPGSSEGCWYDLLRDGLKGHAEDVTDRPGVRRYARGDLAAATTDAAPASIAAEPLPAWAHTPATPEAGAPIALQPSRVPQADGGVDAFADQVVMSPAALADRLRFLRGSLTHALLQHLPRVEPGEREALATQYLEARGGDMTADQRASIWAETKAILDHPEFAPVFGPGSRAEVPIAALVEREEGMQPLAISGQIDRLLVTGDSVLILDYKTNRPPPLEETGVAPGYVHQMAAYRLALASIYPDKTVRPALLWTDGARLMELSPALLDAAEARIRAYGGPALDAPGVDT